jgi:hypothetical protein
MGDVIIDACVQRQNPANRADGEIRPGQETPEAELAGIWRLFLEMIDVDHEGEPPYASS